MGHFRGFAGKTREIEGVFPQKWLFSVQFEWWIVQKTRRYEGKNGGNGQVNSPQRLYQPVAEVLNIGKFLLYHYLKSPQPMRAKRQAQATVGTRCMSQLSRG
jgi:hypothetical protein